MIIQAVFFEFFMERVAIDSQLGGCLGLNIVAFDHHLGNQLAFDSTDDLGVQAVFLGPRGTKSLLYQIVSERFHFDTSTL